MLEQFDTLIKQRAELKKWWTLRSTVAAYDQKRHKLRVDVAAPTMVAFCGQAYAGATNYHDAPKWFISAIRAEMQNEADRITEQAYHAEMARLNSEIQKHHDVVMQALREVDKEVEDACVVTAEGAADSGRA